MGLALSCVLAGFALCLHADNLLLGAYALEGAADLFIHSFLAGVVALCRRTTARSDAGPSA